VKKVALLDDDPVEMTILSGLAETLEGDYAFTRFNTVESFLEAPDRTQFHVLFLDRRIPPHDDFSHTLPLIETSGFSGHVILLTNHRNAAPQPPTSLKVLGPFEKIDIQEPDVLEALLEGARPPGL